MDIHFHGAVGHDFCDGDEEGIQAIADFEASKGVLAICPATMTYSEEILNGVMDAAAAHKNGRGADLVGINMEGPFISPTSWAPRTRPTSICPTSGCSAGCKSGRAA